MKANLLLIDDSEVQSSQITESLQRLGYAVQRASTGAEGLRLAREKPPDLVLLDVVMPDIDGLEFAERLNQLRPGLPVIFCTGYTSAVEALTDCGAMALMKPYSADVLERVIAERLQLAREYARPRLGGT
ncbi:MAG TPA: response regulator [Polyangiaceae bacterium]|nr:response regulator [Polyangiaceae bacterium]